MLTNLKGLKKTGLSIKTLNLPTFLVQVGFFRKNATNEVIIENKLRKETINLGKSNCDITFGAPLFSYLLTLHQNEALRKNQDGNNEITINYGERTALLKFLKERQRHTIKAVEEGIKEFVSKLNPQEIISVNNKKFPIFSTLSFNSKKQTITFVFSEMFIEHLNKDNNPLTYIQIEDLKSLNSNKTSASLFIITSSMSNLNQEKYRTGKYFAQCLLFDGFNKNQKIDSAFKSLEEKGFIKVDKKIKATKIGGKVYFWAIYIFNDIKKSVKKLTKKMKKQLKEIVTVKNDLFNSRTKKIEGYTSMSVSYFSSIVGK